MRTRAGAMIKRRSNRRPVPARSSSEEMVQIVRDCLPRPSTAPPPDYVTLYRKPRGKTRSPPEETRKRWWQNTIICEAVEMVIEHGFNPTRYRGPLARGDHELACSIVAEAISLQNPQNPMSEAKVAKIWETHGPQIGLRGAPARRLSEEERARRTARAQKKLAKIWRPAWALKLESRQ